MSPEFHPSDGAIFAVNMLVATREGTHIRLEKFLKTSLWQVFMMSNWCVVGIRWIRL